MKMRRRLIVFAQILAASSISVGCDSNPEAPTAPSNVIVSDSDSGPSRPKPKANANANAKPASVE